MTAPDDGLEALSSEELHDRAVSRAKHHLDVRFFYDLMKLLPAAEAAAGDLEPGRDRCHAAERARRRHLRLGAGEVGELMRPFYLEYLRKHGVTAR